MEALVTPPLDDPGGWRTGWQHEAASRVERHFRDTSLMPRMHDTEKALLRSQSAPLSGAALSTAPTCFHTRIESHLFHLLLLRRLRLLLPPCVPVCRCGARRGFARGGDGRSQGVPGSRCTERLGP